MLGKKAQAEIIATPGFVILVAMAVGATIIGWMMGPQMGFEERFPVWQLLAILGVEVIACYLVVLKMS